MPSDDLDYGDFINDNNLKGCQCNKPCSQRPCATVPCRSQTCCCRCMNPMGPQGPTGPTGPTGATGAIGPQGPAGENGQNGLNGENGQNGAPGTTGATGDTGPTGPQGSGGIDGITPTIGENGNWYIGDIDTGKKAQGPAGSTGPQGERGPIAAIIPFSATNNGNNNSGIRIAADEHGDPETIFFVGFGNAPYHLGSNLEPGEWAAGTIIVRENVDYPSSFIMPYDGTLQNIYVLFANRTSMRFDEGITMRPFVSLAVSDGRSLAFTILRDTITYTEPYVGGSTGQISKYSLRRGSTTNLNIKIPTGSLVGIVVGWVGEGVTSEVSENFSVSGSLFIE